MGAIKKFFKSREATPLYILLILFFLVGIINSNFFSYENISSTLYGGAMYIVLAIGLSFVIITGEIDVSIGSTLGFCASVAGILAQKEWNVFLILIVVIILGGIIGLINGIGVVKYKVSSIIMTLGTLGIVRGLIYIMTKGRWVENLPKNFKEYALTNIMGINIFFIFSIILVILAQIFLVKTSQGKAFKAIGDNPNGAILVGIKVDFTKKVAFVLSGVFSGIASLIFASRTGFIAPIAGNGYEMVIIAGCVLGGISLSGGVGSIVGSALGVIIMASLSKILVFIGLSADLNNTITGALLILIVVCDSLTTRYIMEKNRKIRLNNRIEGEN